MSAKTSQYAAFSCHTLYIASHVNWSSASTRTLSEAAHIKVRKTAFIPVKPLWLKSCILRNFSFFMNFPLFTAKYHLIWVPLIGEIVSTVAKLVMNPNTSIELIDQQTNHGHNYRWCISQPSIQHCCGTSPGHPHYTLAAVGAPDVSSSSLLVGEEIQPISTSTSISTTLNSSPSLLQQHSINYHNWIQNEYEMLLISVICNPLIKIHGGFF